MKHALVTGATKGIGLAISKQLINEGHFVYMNYGHDESAAKELTFGHAEYCLMKADLSLAASADNLADEMISKDIQLDCIVLNAGATCRKPFGEVDFDEWNDVMNVNVNSSFFLCQRLFPIMKEGGAIVLIGSDMGIYPHALAAYSVSKAASHMLAQSLVKEFATRRIRVNAIAPGFIDTDWQLDKPAWLREKIENKIALKRFGTADEIADACMFLIKNEYMNGAVLQIDGGYAFE